MRRNLFVIFFIGMAACLLSGLGGRAVAEASQAPAQKELILLNWSEYMDPDLLTEFEAQTGIRVKEVYYESEEMRDEMLVASEGRGFDLMIASGNTLHSHARRGWLAPVDSRSAPNLGHIDPRWQEAHPQLVGQAAPLFWGTLGIAYRSDKIGKVDSWRQMFAPQDDLRGRIVMIKDSRDLFNAALKSEGYSLNSREPAQFDQAGRRLIELKPYVRDYNYVALTEESALVKGDVWMALMYNGDALVLQDSQSAIAYSVPGEGTNLWVDYLAILAHSAKKEAAAQFINFLHEPSNAARLSEFLMYATTNREAEKLLPAEFRENPLVYPPPEVLENSEIGWELPPRIVRKCNTVFNQLLQ